ncbi:neuromedin-U receptor 2-like [Ostrea edulis]|uniref:neuromedin-U receptor 2-like n=1 Tax=Ostrea edulis TaxID=37623 RepID=UPI00209507CA|nr:neuromedin-U receptor 2-like [Ostrea edulis]XP_056021926.1 neuromedin-U receptor 2-like [Ostrea edulis]
MALTLPQTTELTLSGNCSGGSCDNSTTNEVTDSLKKAMEILSYTNYFLLPLFLILGLAGHTLTVIIMQTRRYSHLTSRLFLIALALSDSVLLLTQVFNKNFVLSYLQMDVRALSSVGCKAFFVIFKTAKMSSSWFLVFICWERFVAVWFPLRAKMICTKRVAWSLILIVYVLITTYTSIWSYASQITKNNICHPDVYDKTNPSEVSRFGTFLLGGLSIYSLIPMCFLITMTPLIALKLARQGRKRKSMIGKSSRKSSSSDTSRTTIMLVGVIVAYILLISPVTALHMSAFFLRLNAFGSNALGFLIFKEVCQILEQMNYAINFYLYVLTSSLFRIGLKELFSCRSPRQLSRSRSGKTSSGSDFHSSRRKFNESEGVSTISK